MKTIGLILAVILLAGCTSSTKFGECIGVNEEHDPSLEYRLSKWNAFLAVIFVETIIVPIVVVADEHSCPVGVKGAAK